MLCLVCLHYLQIIDLVATPPFPLVRSRSIIFVRLRVVQQPYDPIAGFALALVDDVDASGLEPLAKNGPDAGI